MAKDAEPRTAAAQDEADAPPKPAAPPRRKKILIAAIAAALLAVAGGGAWYFTQGAHPHKKAKAAAAEGEGDAAAEAPADDAGAAEGEEGAPSGSGPPQYVEMNPAFVVNLEDDEALRYMQIDIEVMTRDASVVDAVKLHMPLIRNNLLLLFGQKHYHELVTREGKEKLRAEALAEVQAVMTKEIGKPGVEELYFTSFVMQ